MRALLSLTDCFRRLGSSTSLLSATLWAKDLSLSSTLPRCSLPFSESKEWLGPFASTTRSVSVLDLNSWISLTKSFVAGILSLTFPRMNTVFTPTGACKWTLPRFFCKGQSVDPNSSRFLCWAQPYRLVYDLLFRSRNQAAHTRRVGP